MGSETSVADKIRARDLKQALYDRDPSLCGQPMDDWLNHLLQPAAAKHGDDPDGILLQVIVDLDANIAATEQSGAEHTDEWLRDRDLHHAQRMRVLRDAVNAMRVDLRSDDSPAP